MRVGIVYELDEPPAVALSLREVEGLAGMLIMMLKTMPPAPEAVAAMGEFMDVSGLAPADMEDGRKQLERILRRFFLALGDEFIEYLRAEMLGRGVDADAIIQACRPGH